MPSAIFAFRGFTHFVLFQFAKVVGYALLPDHHPFELLAQLLITNSNAVGSSRRPLFQARFSGSLAVKFCRPRLNWLDLGIAPIALPGPAKAPIRFRDSFDQLAGR